MTKALEKITVIPQDDLPASMPIPQVHATTSLINVLARAMSDPSVDVEKVERYAALYERAIARDDAIAFNSAMAKAQAAMRPVAADASNPQTRSKYATYAALDAKARPIYSAHGFSLSFDTAEGAPENCIRVVCFVSVGGHSRTYHIDMPADGKGAKGNDVMTRTHATGAGVTYGRRYLLGMIFNLVIGEDDDGNAAAGYIAPGYDSAPSTINAKQIKELIELCDKAGCDKAKLCEVLKVDGIPQIEESQYQRAINLVRNNARRNGVVLP